MAEVHHEQQQVTVTTQGEPTHQETVVHVDHQEKKKKKDGSAGTATPNKTLNKEELGLFIICIVIFLYSIVTWAVLGFAWALVWVRGWIITAACVLGSLGAWNVYRPVTLFFCLIATIVAAALAIVDLIAGLIIWIPSNFVQIWIPIVIFVAIAFVLYFLLFLFAFRLRGRSLAWVAPK